MSQDDYNEAYEAGLRAAALTAERVRDVCYQRGRADEAEGAERVRVLIQDELNWRRAA
jgi:hypothetical protein